MGFEITAPTDIPVDGDGSQNVATWGEDGGPFTVPSPMEDDGFDPATALNANSLNYPYSRYGRWIRSLVNRSVFADEGLFATCIVSQGTWNIGAATLNVTLTPTRVVVDATGDGGVVLEIKGPPGSPETLTANKDTYLNLDEEGNYELQEVGNGAGAPTPTVGYVNIWILVTDAGELTSVSTPASVIPAPCFLNLCALAAIILGDATVLGDLALTGEARFTDSGTTLPTVAGAFRNNGTFWSVRDTLGVHTFSDQKRGYDPTFAVSAGELDTGAVVTRRIAVNERVWVTLTFRYENSVADIAIISKITYTSGVGNGTVLNTTVNADLAARGYTAAFELDWGPSDDAIVTEADFTFTARLGNASGNLAAAFIGLKVTSNFKV